MAGRLRVHGGDIFGTAHGWDQKELLDFSANINPLGVPPGVKRAAEDSIRQIVNYPDPYCRKLVCALAESCQVPKAWILCGNGAADLIFRLVCALRPGQALLAVPTFSEYEEALTQGGSRIRFYEMGEDLRLHEDFMDMVTPELDLIFLCSPNNPTGLCIEKSFLKEILERAKRFGIILAVDECFMDFVQNAKEFTLFEELKSYKNLILLKSFTKIFAIPGLRLGCAFCQDASLLDRMSRAGAFWSVNTLAQAAGVAALAEKDFVKKTAALISRERSWLYDELKKTGYRVYPGQANYLLLKAEGGGLYEKMLDAGILIRRCVSFRGLTDEYFRVAVKKHEDNLRLVEVLRRFKWQG